MIRVGITGGHTFRAGELIRILINHPDVEIRWVYTDNNTNEVCPDSIEFKHNCIVGSKISDYHNGLDGDTDLVFCDSCDFKNINMLFLCSNARDFMEKHKDELTKDIKIIDLTGEFIFNDEYDFVYGLPEINRKKLVRGATRAVCPSLLANAIALTLLPIAKNLLINSNLNILADINSALIDSTSEQEEVKQVILSLQSNFNADINITQVCNSVDNGVLIKTRLLSNLAEEEVKHLYENYYSDHNFVYVTPKTLDKKSVANTNKCLINIEKQDGELIITAAIDGTVKGCAGTAVHNMNLIFGLSEKIGLQLKAYVY